MLAATNCPGDELSRTARAISCKLHYFDQFTRLYLTEERINKVIELSKHDDIIDRLVRSVGMCMKNSGNSFQFSSEHIWP